MGSSTRPPPPDVVVESDDDFNQARPRLARLELELELLPLSFPRLQVEMRLLTRLRSDGDVVEEAELVDGTSPEPFDKSVGAAGAMTAILGSHRRRSVCFRVCAQQGSTAEKNSPNENLGRSRQRPERGASVRRADLLIAGRVRSHGRNWLP